MSVRAYRINKIDHEKDNTFNLWHDDEIMKVFEEHGFYDTMTEGSGIGDLPLEALEEALIAIKKSNELKVEDKKWLTNAIKKDIKWMKKNGDNYISYYCY